jgi:hypothetical protein
MSLKLLKNDFSSFFEVPFNISQGSYFVSPLKDDLKRFLDTKKNPLFSSPEDLEYFTAIRDGKPVGRIIAHIHRASNVRHKVQQAYFGFFECENNPETAALLLEAASAFGKKHGMTELVGNMNMTAMQQMGVMTDGFDQIPYSDQVYSLPHIPGLLEGAGFEKFFPMSTFELKLSDYTPGSLLTDKTRSSLASEGINIRSIQKSNIDQGLKDARVVLNSGFDKNPFFVPVTPEEFHFQAKDLSWVIDHKITTFAYQGDRPVGVVICIPDLNPLLSATKSRITLATPWHYLQFRRNRKRAVIIYYSVCEDLHGRGIAAHLLDQTLNSLIAGGYETLGITWIADVNKASLRQMEKIGAKKTHQLYLFRKSLK